MEKCRERYYRIKFWISVRYTDLGSDTPKLVRTLLLFIYFIFHTFFLIGIHFALRGEEEHENLRFGSNSQLKISYAPRETKYYPA